MTHKIYTVYDSKAECYSQPFIQKQKGEAIRGFIDISNDKSTSIGMHPEDFTLFEIGEWSELEGKIEMHKTKVSCGMAHEFKKQQVKGIEMVKNEKIS